MFYMQDEAEKYAKLFPECKKLNAIAHNCCCASTALWVMGIPSEKHLEIIVEEYGKSLDEECTVTWAAFFKNVCGKKIKVEFRDIKSLDEIKNIKGKILVKFKEGKNAHWVGVEKGKVAYNSIAYSNCVTNGKPVTARIITFI